MCIRDRVRAVKLPLAKIKVIYNPVDLKEVTQKAKEPLDHPWFINKDIPVILGVGMSLIHICEFTQIKNWPPFFVLNARWEGAVCELGNAFG